MTGLERLRNVANAMRGYAVRGGGPLDLELMEIADRIERETERDPKDDVSMSAYDLLPECDRKAISLALDCGGVEEIKKRLMPEGMEWPRYEDGELIRFGDEFENAKGNASTLRTVVIKDCRDALGGAVFWKLGKGECAVTLKNGERVKRPAPKVYDTDGVEIHVGDTVCGTRDMEPMRVVDTDSRECGFKRIKCEKEGDGFFFYCADELTHKLTVFAADGKPLREGETVWYTQKNLGYPIECRIEKVNGDGSCELIDVVIPTNRPTVNPGKLTHERPAPPDSWERLEEDADKNPFDYCKDVGHRLDTCENSEAYKARDLVRRAKKLAGFS